LGAGEIFNDYLKDCPKCKGGGELAINFSVDQIKQGEQQND
jgi:hypothetical protein